MTTLHQNTFKQMKKIMGVPLQTNNCYRLYALRHSCKPSTRNGFSLKYLCDLRFRPAIRRYKIICLLNSADLMAWTRWRIIEDFYLLPWLMLLLLLWLLMIMVRSNFMELCGLPSKRLSGQQIHWRMLQYIEANTLITEKLPVPL